MEFRTCEEYVLNKIQEQEKEIEGLNEEIDRLSNMLDETYEKLGRLKHVIATYGERDIFSSGEQISVTVSGASYADDSERAYFHELAGMFSDLPTKDYSKSDEVKTND